MSELHGAQLPIDGLHVAIRYDVADQAERDLLVLTPDDVGALLLQRDLPAFFALVSVTPVTWTQFADGETTLSAILALNAELLERVEGPPASNDNAVARWDGSTGKLLKDSLVTIDHLGNIDTPGMVDGVDVSNLAMALALVAVPSYVTLASTPTLGNERVLTAGPGIAITDSGPGSPVTIEATGSVGAPANAEYLVSVSNGALTAERVLTAGTNITLTPGAGTLTIASTGAGAPIDAEFLVSATHAGLTAERVLTAGTGITLTPAAGTLTVASTVTPPTAPVGAPPDVAASSATGTPGAYATSNHTHGHGNQAGGALHAVVTTSAAGFASAADKLKLDGIASGATNTPMPPTAPGAAPPNVGAASVTGTAGSYATATHTHGHGDQAGGTLHALVTTSTPGFASAADKVRIDALPSAGAAPLDAEYLVSTTSTGLSAERVLTAGAGISLTPAAGTLTVASTAPAGAPTTAQYLTLATDATLTDERVLTAGTGVQLTDAGAGGALTLSSTHNGAQIIVTAATFTLALSNAGKSVNFNNSGGTALTVPNTSTVNFPIGTEIFLFQSIPPAGQVTITGAAGVNILIPPGKVAKTAGTHATVKLRHLDTNNWSVEGELEDATSVLTLGTTAGYPNERVLTAGTGVQLTDAGAGGALTVSSTGNGLRNVQTGTAYTLVLTDAGKTVQCSNAGAFTLTVPNTSTVNLAQGTEVFLFQGGPGQVSIVAAGSVTLLVPPGKSAAITAENGTVRLYHIVTNIWVLEGDLVDTTSFVTLGASAGYPNERVLTAGSGISLVDGGAGGALTINAAGGAPTSAQYLTLATDATLTNERVLTAGNGTGIAFTDAGAGGALTVRQEIRYTSTAGATYTPVLSDAWASIGFAVACAVTIPPDTTTNFPLGTKIFLQQSATGAAYVSVSAGAGVTLDVPTARNARTRGANTSIYIHKILANYWMIGGDLEDAKLNHKLYASAPGTQSIPAGGGGVRVTLTATYDPNSNFAGDVYTVPATGWYLVMTELQIGTATVSSGLVRIRQNGAAFNTQNAIPVAGYNFILIKAFTIYPLNGGDQIDLVVIQNSAAAATLTPGSLSIHRLS